MKVCDIATLVEYPLRRSAREIRCCFCLAVLAVLAAAACRDAVSDADGAQRAARIVELGRVVFFDAALSADGRVACATSGPTRMT
jgi:cytochrome c peroxidase